MTNKWKNKQLMPGTWPEITKSCSVNLITAFFPLLFIPIYYSLTCANTPSPHVLQVDRKAML